MPTIVEMPRLSDTMEEGTLAAWLKEVGDAVAAGDALADIETDKAVMTFESFDDGVLLTTLIGPGDTVPLGAPIAILGKKGEDVAGLAGELRERLEALASGGGAPETDKEPSDADKPSSEADKEPSEADEESSEADQAAAKAPPKRPAPSSAAGDARGEDGPAAAGGDLAPPAPTDADGVRVKASPLARRIAATRGVDLTTVAGSGPGGRVIRRDVEDLDPTRRVRAATAVGGASVAAREDELVRVSQMRKTIAKRLVESKQSAPHYYLTVTLDADRLVALRAELNDAGPAVKLSYNDLILRACVVALGAHPAVNVAWEGANIRRFAGVHIGFAVALEHGLITPVVRDADALDLVTLAVRVRDLAEAARAQRLDSSDYTGASFTVSNLGMFGIEQFTAVINPPGACILAVGALRKEPTVKGDEVVVGHRLTLTLSCDHRAVDGATGAAFLRDLKALLEAPLGLFVATAPASAR